MVVAKNMILILLVVMFMIFFIPESYNPGSFYSKKGMPRTKTANSYLISSIFSVVSNK